MGYLFITEGQLENKLSQRFLWALKSHSKCFVSNREDLLMCHGCPWWLTIIKYELNIGGFLSGSSACLEGLFCPSSSFHGSILLPSGVLIVLCRLTLVVPYLLGMAKSFCTTDRPLLFFHSFPGSPFQVFDHFFSWWLILLLKSSIADNAIPLLMQQWWLL